MKAFFARLSERRRAFLAREREKTKNMTRKEKWSYVFSAYWLEMFIAAVAICVVVVLCIFLDNATKQRILYVAVVDSDFSASQSEQFAADFKASIGDKRRKDTVLIDTSLAEEGGLPGESENYYEQQEKSIVYVGAALVDAYVCPESYVSFLKRYEDAASVRETLGDELYEKYSDRIVDDTAILLGDTLMETSGAISYEPAYLVFTGSVHRPEVVRQFVSYILES